MKISYTCSGSRFVSAFMTGKYRKYREMSIYSRLEDGFQMSLEPCSTGELIGVLFEGLIISLFCFNEAFDTIE